MKNSLLGLFILPFIAFMCNTALAAMNQTHIVEAGESFSLIVLKHLKKNKKEEVEYTSSEFKNAFTRFKAANLEINNFNLIHENQEIKIPLQLEQSNRHPTSSSKTKGINDVQDYSSDRDAEIDNLGKVVQELKGVVEELKEERMSQSQDQLINHKSRWGASVLYDFYSLKAENQANGFSSEVLSEFSPGFELFYENNRSKSFKYGIRGTYQRAVFSQPDVNNLEKNEANTFSGSLYFVKNMLSFLDLHMELGYESNLYLKSLSVGQANIESVERGFGLILLQPKLIEIIGPYQFQYKFELGYKYNSSATEGADTIDGNGTAIVGMMMEKKVQNRNYTLGLRYLQSSFDVNAFKQDFESLRFYFQLSFGGVK